MKTCIIVDLDGTLSLFDRNKKNPYDRDFENDELNLPVGFLVNAWATPTFTIGNQGQPTIFFLSGRNDKFRKQTEKFLYTHLPALKYELIMRKDGDFRKDVILKEEMYKEHIKDKYEVKFVIDDRLQVCRLWYSLGLFVFNVNQGLEEF